MKLKEHLGQYWFLYVAIVVVIFFLIIMYKLKMSLTLIGLILSFIGSVILILDAFLSFGKEPTHFIPSKFDKDGRPTKFIREKKIYGINNGWGGYEEVKISKEEIILIFSLSLMSLGFLLQILNFIPKDFWAKLLTIF